MDKASILTAFNENESEIKEAAALLEVRQNGNLVRFYTGTRYRHRSRLLARIIGILLFAAGIGLVRVTPWTLAIALAGIPTFFVVPRMLEPSLLLELNGDQNLLIVTQLVIEAGTIVPLDQIRTIRAVYETKGWDPFSTLYAVLENGTEIPCMMVFGGDDALTEMACHLLGLLLNCPATYTGPFGSTTICYSPS